MIQQINFSAFVDAFRHAGRADQFGYSALRALFDYLEELEDSTGEPLELDVIALCCDWAEATAAEILIDYAHDLDTPEDEGDQEAAALAYLCENTHTIELAPGHYIYAQF
jgi:hypothetical protein